MRNMKFSFVSGCALSLVLIEASGCAVDDGDPAASEVASDPLTATTMATDDSFQVSTFPTSEACGRLDFVDFGPGAPGGGDNDDYLVIHDFCSDSHGVLARALLIKANGDVFEYGPAYNGNGLAGAPIYWDPWHDDGNVNRGDFIELEVCLSDGLKPIESTCNFKTKTSSDG